jgi:hypothetical protein
MNGELAQIIALVAHGNLFLHDGGKTQVDLSANSTFQYVSSIKFARYKTNQDQQGIEIAASVPDWFAFLLSNRVTHLWNVAFAWQRQDLKEYDAAGFSGGVPKAIQADLPEGFELWYPQWKTGGPQGKPWLIEYRSLMFPNSYAFPAPNMGVVKDRLRQAVSQARSFSERPETNTGQWTDRFAKALALLDSPGQGAPFHPDMLTETGFGLEARQILASAAQAYVFGGMGSWNDMGYENSELQKEYECITAELFEAIKLCTVAASNSFSL